MTLAELVIKSYDQTLTREQRGEFYRQAVELAQSATPKEKRKPKSDVPEGFDEWYKHYPHKVARGYAEKAYAKARGIATQEQLIKGANWYAQNKPEETPWAHPASWLNAKRWLDGQSESTYNTDNTYNSDLPEWKQKISDKIGKAQTSTWFKDAEYLVDPYPDQWNVKTDYVIVSKFSYQWIKDHYITELKSIFGNIELGMK